MIVAMMPHERTPSRGADLHRSARTASLRIAPLAIVLTLLGGAVPSCPAAADPRFVPDRRQLAEIEHVLAKRYFRKIPRESLESAARLCLAGRLDPYSTWFDPAQRAEFHRMLAGEADPATPDAGDGRPAASDPARPAPPADPRIGDLALPPTHATADAAVAPLASPPAAVHEPTPGAARSTTSVLGVRADGDDAARWLVDVPARIAYVRILRFTARTAGEMDAALAAVNRLGARGLVIDLRGDPGGLMRSAVAVTDRFLDSGTIVTLRRRKKTIVRHAHREVATRVPLAVLVDGRTASAAEMMAASLQDHRRAVLVGRPTFGKGAVQQVFRLKRSPGSLKLTTALYRRPSGALVEEHIPGAGGSGVTPDPGFAITPDDARLWSADVALERALTALRPAADATVR